MCSGSGFSLIGVGDEEMILAKNYGCLDCNTIIKGLGVVSVCPRCKSKNVKRTK